MKIKKHPISKRSISIFLILAMLFILTAGMVPTIGVAALPSHKNGTMTSARTVYCLPSSQGNGMSIGSVSSGEAVKVYWQEGSDYYIEYTVSSGSYSGYKRGYVPASSVSVSGVGSIGYTSFTAHTTSNQTVYNRSNTSALSIGTVYSTDSITVLQEDGSWYYIQYPISGGYKRGYVPKSTVSSSSSSTTQPTGNFEVVNSSQIGGWAWISTSPNTSINVRIRITNVATGTSYIYLVAANQYRADLYAAGIGNGYHAFSYSINWNNYPVGVYSVEVYGIGGSDPLLPNSPRTYNLTSSTYFGTGTYYIKNVNSSKYLNVHNSGTANGTNVNQYANNYSANQQWKLSSAGSGYYLIKPSHSSNLALAVDDNYTSNSSNISVRTLPSGTIPDYFQWKIVSVGNGAYKVISKCSGTAEKAMMVEASSLADGANVKQYTYYGTHNDEWVFESLRPYAAMNWRYVFDDLDLVKIYDGYDSDHPALDIVSKNGPGLIRGAEIKSPADGNILWSTYDSGAGYYVIIETNDIDPSTGNKIRVGFQHLDHLKFDNPNPNIAVIPISKGTVIGTVGNTGEYSTGYHLHLYMMRDEQKWTTQGRTINPQNFYPQIPFTNETGGPYVLEIP